MCRAPGLLLLPAAGLAGWLASLFPSAVERAYSRGAYRLIAAGLVCTIGRIPFALDEWLLAGAVLAVPWLGWRALRPRSVGGGENGKSRLLRVLRDVWISAGAIYCAFLLLWGLNYRRQPFCVSAGLDLRPVSVAELYSVSRDLLDSANDLRRGLPEDAAGTLRLDRSRAMRGAGLGFARAAAEYGFLAGASPQPKLPWLSPVLSYAGVSGIFVPLTGEANVNATLPDVELPFAACHELAHQRGFAREDEANYIGYLACRLHPAPSFRYSAALMAGLHVQAALTEVARVRAAELASRRSAAVRRDVEALRRWSTRYAGPFERLSKRVNDAYLRSQGQTEGVRSYGRMVDLLVAERRQMRSGAAR